MSNINTIAAEIRTDVGKGASRRLRRDGKVPAVLYGDEKEPVALTLTQRDVLHAAEHESFFSSILEIQAGDGRTQRVVVRDMQRHPFRQMVMHLDFMRVSATERLRISLPLHFIGEKESPAGRASGVVIQHLVTELEVSALPDDLPEYLEVDLSHLDAGDAVMLSDIQPPAGVRIPGQHAEDAEHVMIANALHISESQGTGAAAEAEAEALAAEEGELLAEGEEGEEEGEAAEGQEPGEEEGEQE